MKSASPETRLEIKSTLSLSGIFGLRMLGVFMFIPIFTAYTQDLIGATPFLMGIAMGIYGLTQAIFQIPLGAWSDKFGRKPIAILGLFIFGVGSLIGAFAHSIIWMIVARALQGVGAIGSTLMALLADLTSEKNRTKAMAVVGISMGLFSAIAIGIGPVIAQYFGLSGVFFTAVFLTIGSFLILCFLVPSSHLSYKCDTTSFQSLRSALKNSTLLRLDLDIFFLHTIFTAAFYACPLMLKPLLTNTGNFYLIILGSSFLFLFPLIGFSEKKKQIARFIFLVSVGLLCFSQVLLIFWRTNLYFIGTALLLFFVGFNFLESVLPSMVSKTASPAAKGSAMGIYSCSQFMGIFVGGILAGGIFSWQGMNGIFIFTSFLCFIWFFISFLKKEKL